MSAKQVALEKNRAIREKIVATVALYGPLTAAEIAARVGASGGEALKGYLSLLSATREIEAAGRRPRIGGSKKGMETLWGFPRLSCHSPGVPTPVGRDPEARVPCPVGHREKGVTEEDLAWMEHYRTPKRLRAALEVA
jgi:hypothetical protein